MADTTQRTQEIGARNRHAALLSLAAYVVAAGAVVIPPLMAAGCASRAGSGEVVRVPAASSPSSREPLRVGGNIGPPTKIRNVAPIYPPEAREAGVEGVVILELIVGQTGDVSEVTVLRSVPMLDAAAVDAVKQWQYVPTLLNGEPVDLLMTVTMNFNNRQP